MNLPSAPLSGYEIQRVLGQGAYGLVYLALDLKSNQLCAIKEFPINAQAFQMFFHELSILFTLNHQNIIRCFNLIQGQGDRNYLVFEYAEKGTLRDHMAEGTPWDEKESLSVIGAIVSGLEEAHRHQIIHRDIKPENILICLQDDVPFYKLGDLGVALSRGASEAHRLSSGSPAYMAPEQFYDTSSPQSDFYSVGILLYELLTGDRPFHGSPEALFTAHSSQEADLSKIKNEKIAALVRDLLHKQAFQRPAQASEILERIDAIFADCPAIEPLFLAEDWPALNATFSALEKCVAQKIVVRLIPGGEHLFAPNPSQLSAFWISDDRQTDLFDLTTQRLLPQILAEPIRAIFPATSETYFITPQHLYSYQWPEPRFQRIFESDISAKALQVDLPRKLFYYADNHRILATTLPRRPLWQIACPNYYLPPRMMVLADGSLVATSGPAAPQLSIISLEGVLLKKIPVPGPVLELWTEAGSDAFSALILGLGVQEPARLLTFQNHEMCKEKILEPGLYAGRHHGDFLALHFTKKNSQLLNRQGELICEIPDTGNLISEAWLPVTQHYGVLSKEDHQTRLHVFQLSSLSVSSFNHNVSAPLLCESPTS